MSCLAGDHSRGVDGEIARMRIVEMLDELTDKELVWLAAMLAGLPQVGRMVKAMVSWPQS